MLRLHALCAEHVLAGKSVSLRKNRSRRLQCAVQCVISDQTEHAKLESSILCRYVLQVVALVANDLLVVANAGDSRCIACRGGVAHAMTNDHKPTDELEAARIRKVAISSPPTVVPLFLCPNLAL